ncbi:MAG: TrkA C-terminal domain-containing protein [Verrucomicrobiales bacterium]|nr:TrkA C-terminal domain-containing protein [Verrucomicrobiales bacterium]
MAPLVALLVIALVSLILVRVGGMALMMTGLSWDAASFQAYSAFFGVGFTTREAELVVNHPVRRRIIRDLIFAGNIGLTSALATLVMTLVQTERSTHVLWMLLMLTGGLAAVFGLFGIGLVRRTLDRAIHWSLKRAGMVRVMDYELLLRIQAGYVVSEVEVLPGCALDGRELKDIRPKDASVLILAIRRDGQQMDGLPQASDVLRAGDVVTAYGPEHAICRLCSGDAVAKTEPNPSVS